MVKITEKLNTIETAKDDIKIALENKGVEVGDVSITEYAEKIDNMDTGANLSEYYDVIPTATQTKLLKAIKKVPVIDMINMEDAQSFYAECSSLESIEVKNTQNVEFFNSLANGCNKLKSVSGIDTSDAVGVMSMFYNCYLLQGLPLFDFGKVYSMGTFFVAGCNNLTDLGGFKDLGKGYTQKTANYNSYTLSLSDCRKLTHESLMNVINNLYDLNLTYNVANGGTLYTQKLVIGSTNISKLSADELNVATAKGWTVS